MYHVLSGTAKALLYYIVNMSSVGMAIRVRVSCHPRVFDPTDVGAILHPWIHPHPIRTESGVGAGFIFHP
jgi:hypothetical protein